MSPAEWDQLNRRLDEQFGHVHERLDALHAALQTLERAVEDRLDRHAVYHRANEPHWGPERLAQRHPFRFALAAAALAWALLVGAPESWGWLRESLLALLRAGGR